MDGTYGGGDGHASRDEVSRSRASSSHHAKLAFVNKLDQIVDLALEAKLLLIGGLVGVGGLVASSSVGERHD